MDQESVRYEACFAALRKMLPADDLEMIVETVAEIGERGYGVFSVELRGRRVHEIKISKTRRPIKAKVNVNS